MCLLCVPLLTLRRAATLAAVSRTRCCRDADPPPPCSLFTLHQVTHLSSSMRRLCIPLPCEPQATKRTLARTA